MSLLHQLVAKDEKVGKAFKSNVKAKKTPVYDALKRYFSSQAELKLKGIS